MLDTCPPLAGWILDTRPPLAGWMLDAGCLMLVSGCWFLDAGWL